MTAVADLTRALVAAGMDAGDAGELVARAAAELATPTKSKGALRTEKWRTKKASQTVTERHAVTPDQPTPEASPNVTDRHKPSPRDEAHISTSSETQKDSSKKEGRKLEAPRSKRPSRIPADWQLDQRHIDHAISKGIAPDRVPVLGEKFKNYFEGASGKTAVSPDWFRKWCTWCLNEIEWNGTNGAKSHQGRTAGAAGPAATGQDAILAGMGRLANRVRDRAESERRQRDVADDDGAAQGDDARLL